MDTQKATNIVEIQKRLDELRAEREDLLHAASEIKGEHLKAYAIRPSGRHLLTIGEDLIQDQYAAIVELVKNSYDADSPDATIIFRYIKDEDTLEICVQDHGHGMSTEDVINKWLVPSTNYKLSARKSPSGRIMQGRKGIGRYAASILGDDFKLQTIDNSGVETSLSIRWSDLSKYQYLDQIQVPIETRQTDKRPGTTLTMRSKYSQNKEWNLAAFKKLRFELKKLIPPKEDSTFDSNFKVILKFENYFADEEENRCEIIKPYPILDFYDYRISGNISSDGFATLTYESKKIPNTPSERINTDYGPTGCGSLSIDIRVYDRDKEAIDQLILRGLQDESGNYVTKLQARQLLNDVNGIGVYRNGFRIRPLGDADFDWLKLNEQRIQNPSMKIGSNQVVGYVHVESEEKSGLEEKSARDGLKENQAYKSLKEITCKVIVELEKRRYVLRKLLGLSKPSKKIERQLDFLYDYTSLKKSISYALMKAGTSSSVVEKINGLILQEENRKNETIDEIRHIVSVYQGQATLGKIVNIILHEGRRPLNYFKNQIPNLRFYGSKFADQRDEESYNQIIRLTYGVSDNAEIFVNLFGRLDPLAARRRDTKTKFLLFEALKGAISIFEKEYAANGIKIILQCPSTISFIGWKQDIYTILANLLDNSLFWIVENCSSVRVVEIHVAEIKDGFILDYTDSGPGISDDILESGVIFEPEFTTKPQGTGLGLSIAGEAAARNGLTLTAVQAKKGAHFILSTDK